MELTVINQQGEKVEPIEVSDALFKRPYNATLVHQLITAFLANARFANLAQLTRAEVKHSTRKPWRQKGTGRARAGMSSSPIWRGGGRAFPSSSLENFSQKVNRKVYRAGMATILSKLVQDGRLQVIDQLVVASSKTKDFVALLDKLDRSKEILCITKEMDENLYRSSRNLRSALVMDAIYTDPYSLIRFKRVFITLDAVQYFEKQWS
ncbi:MAG: 50S ribosomal protein L4 [Neisseriales bacterium]|nr:MAG: 50S ribosomal protein L4 [Neisseriales bacterium]